MANTTNKKFGVVHGAPSQLSTATIEEGKLYFLAGEADGAIKQGIYGVDGITADASGNVTDYNLAMFGCGSVADGTGYGLSQANFTTDEKNKLAGIAANANNYSLPLAATNTRGGIQVGFTAKDASIPVLLSGEDAYVQLTKTSIEKGLGYTINASVPSGAKFTDTDTWRAINVNGTQKIANNVSTALDISAGNNIEVSFSDNKVVIAAKNVDASNADHANTADHATNATNASTADKVAQTFDVSFDGADILSFNGSTNRTLAFKEGSNIDITNSNGTLTIATTGVPTTTEMNDAINTALSSALQYKGTVKDGSVLPTSGNKKGDVYVASDAYTTSQNNVSYKCETGDLFIFNGSYFDIVNGENQVENKNATLSIGGSTPIATVDGTDITVSLPSSGYYTHPLAGDASQSLGNAAKNTTVTIGTETKIATVYDVSFDASGHYKGKVARDISINITSNNTDEKVKANTSTGKFYLIGQDDATNGTTETAYKNASVYVDGGYLYSGGDKVLTSYNEKYTGTVTSITPGTGLTNGTTENAITSSGTLNLKIASSSEIGGVKPGTTVANNKIYGVQVNASTGEMTVNVPWADNTDEKVKDASGTGKSFILGHASQGSTAAATTNAYVYMESGKMYATSGSVASNDTALVTGGTVYTAVEAAKEAAKEAATIYWETL